MGRSAGPPDLIGGPAGRDPRDIAYEATLVSDDAPYDQFRAGNPSAITKQQLMGVRVFTDMNEGLKGVDVIIMLRLQNERMTGALLPSAQEYFKKYGLTPERLALARPDAIVMHPGPMNRGVEIDSAVADGSQAVILPQVTFGIAVRMAVMSMLAGA